MSTNHEPQGHVQTITPLNSMAQMDHPSTHVSEQHQGHGNHWMHLLMCALMLLIVAWALWSGGATSIASGLAIIAPAAICMGMMMLMMRLMGHGSNH